MFLFFLFLLCGIHFLLWCPLRGLWWSDQFHCYNTRQSHFGSILTGSLWIIEPQFSEHGVSDLWFQLNHTLKSRWLSGVLKCLQKTWCITSISLNRWDVALLSAYENQPHIVWPHFLPRSVNFRWESDRSRTCTQTHKKPACFGWCFKFWDFFVWFQWNIINSKNFTNMCIRVKKKEV